MKIQVLISKGSWANIYVNDFKKILSNYSHKIKFLNDHRKLRKNFDVNIIFSYFNLINKKYLNRSKYNIVPHESDLPKGRGMSPITWQLLKNKNIIIFSLIEASEKLDAGDVYYKKKVSFKRDLLFHEIKKIQFEENLKLIKKFLLTIKKKKFAPKAKPQKGTKTFFKLRTKKNSKINIHKSLKSQFNLIRLSDFENYPAFFNIYKKKYLIQLIKEK